ncbi:MAG: sulfatase [Bacteroidota bacterium]
MCRSINWVQILGCSLLINFLACTQAPEQKSLPNILFIAIDDLRPSLGCYGNTEVHSPVMDQLAAEGAVFLNHFTQVPTCGPSRHCLLTGNRPRNRAELRNNIFEETIAKATAEGEVPESFVHLLRQNDYHTVGIGKISHSADGLVYGYEDSVSTVKEMPFSWDEFLFDAGKWQTGWNAFFAYASGENRQSFEKEVKPYERGAVDDLGYPDGLTANLAIQKLKELKQQDKPFFMGVGFFKPHLPFNSPEKYWELYERDSLTIASNPSLPQDVDLLSLHGSSEFNQYQLGEEKASLQQSVSDDYARKLYHAYYACISYVDAQLGRVLAELEAQGLADNTIIVLWGDHGWHLGHQRVWGKHTIFENALRSSLIVKLPEQVQKGIKVPTIVETVDIYPTLMELCEIKIPHQIDGESFASLLTNPEAQAAKTHAYGYFRNGITLRTDQYRLTKYFREAMPNIELYDHHNDPDESLNIAADNPEIVAQLMPLLDAGDTGLYQ